MILDSKLTLSSAQAITVTAASTNVIDLTQAGAGNAPDNFFGTAAIFGEDIGIGDGVSPPQIACIVGVALVGDGDTALQVQLEAAIDNGSGSPGTYKVLAETDALVETVLLAGTKIAEFTIPPRAPGQAFPRFYRLNYVVSAGTFISGTIGYAGIVTGRDDAPMYPAAY